MSKPPIDISRVIVGVLSNRCPRCSEGHVYSGIIKMNETCPHCGLIYEREQGYFTGAMMLSYIIGFFAILPVLVFLIAIDAPAWTMVAVPGLELSIMAPFTFRWSRLLWLYLDRRIEP